MNNETPKGKLLSRKDKTMTVTRKDLNAITNTFNERILFYLEVRGLEDRAAAVWFTAEEMYDTMLTLNPNVDYSKWRKAILKDTGFDMLEITYSMWTRLMPAEECKALAQSLYDSGAESTTVTKDVLTVDEHNPCTYLDWRLVLKQLASIEIAEA